MFVTETTNSREATDGFEGSTGRLNWVIQLEGSETETSAHDYIVANAPTTFTAATGTSYKYQSVSIKPLEAGNGLLDVEVTYAQAKPLQFSFQTGGGSEKIDYSRGFDGEAGTRASIHSYHLNPDDTTEKDGDSAPDFQGGINVTKTSVEGATIQTAQFQFKITKSWAKGKTINAYGPFTGRAAHDAEAAGYRYLSTDGNGSDTEPPARQPILYVHGSGSGVWTAATHVSGEIDGTYMRDVERMTSMYNLYPFTIIIEGIWMHFATGELLFQGTDGGKMNDDRFELTYSFAVSRNIYADPENPSDPNGRMLGRLYISEKLGWDLLWARQDETTDAGVLIRRPTDAYVERVYDFDDFAKLRLDE